MDSLKIYDTITVSPFKIIEYYMEADGFTAPHTSENIEEAMRKVANYIVHLKINHAPPIITRREADPGDEM